MNSTGKHAHQAAASNEQDDRHPNSMGRDTCHASHKDRAFAEDTGCKLPINRVSATVNHLHGLSRHAAYLAITLSLGNTKLLSLGAKWHAREPHLAPTSLSVRLGSRLWPPSRRSPPGRMLERGQRQSCHASLRALWRSTCCSGTLIHFLRCPQPLTLVFWARLWCMLFDCANHTGCQISDRVSWHMPFPFQATLLD